ncbi:MAG: tetratricopeptide repeat protein [Steroidobacteraceae bacterium]
MDRATSLAGLALLTAFASGQAAGGELRDLHYGEAVFEAHQGRYFEALQRLDTELAQYHGLDEPSLDSLTPHLGSAEFSVGDFELNYRMHHRAGRAIQRVLEADVEDAVRNEAAYRLARIHFQKDQLEEALAALGRIRGDVPKAIRDDIEFLRANVYLAQGRAGAAVSALRDLPVGADLTGFAAYNLGIALLQDGQLAEAVEQLDEAGRIGSSDEATQGIRDKANLVLGSLLFELGQFDRAEQTLDRVRLEGPFSNQALLRAGWSEASVERFDRALVPWKLLLDRDQTDAAVQEALLAVPQAYASLDAHGRAALLFGQALESYGVQIERVDASIDSIRDGRFLEALVREEIRQSKDWVIRLRSLPESPETFYLMQLMASHDFQTALQNYLDLEDLRSKLLSWQSSFDAFEDVIRVRGEYYDPRLPEVDADFRELDARMRTRLEQRRHLATRLQGLLTAPQPELLATEEERVTSERLSALAAQLTNSSSPEALALLPRLARLQGVVTWQVRTQYHERLTAAHTHLAELVEHVDALAKQHHAFVRSRQAATHGYLGYDRQIEQLRKRVGTALARLDLVMGRQGHLIETVAVRELKGRRERLVSLQTQARYAVADSYDRAVGAQQIGQVQ